MQSQRWALGECCFKFALSCNWKSAAKNAFVTNTRCHHCVLTYAHSPTLAVLMHAVLYLNAPYLISHWLALCHWSELDMP